MSTQLLAQKSPSLQCCNSVHNDRQLQSLTNPFQVLM